MEKCHTPRSDAKKRPASSRGTKREGVPSLSFSRDQTQIHSNGTASAQRQKALATGPTSERRTRIGANAMAVPPARRQRKANRLMEARIISPHMNVEFLSAVVLLLLVVDPF